MQSPSIIPKNLTSTSECLSTRTIENYFSLHTSLIFSNLNTSFLYACFKRNLSEGIRRQRIKIIVQLLTNMNSYAKENKIFTLS